ncbi:MAG: hypothetical protein LBD24_06630, partial [Spirochaetaceae bacterium]|nr:hypothetical protein [Spirochaetaceae bacterium]
MALKRGGVVPKRAVRGRSLFEVRRGKLMEPSETGGGWRDDKWPGAWYTNEYMRIFGIPAGIQILFASIALTLAACDGVDLGREWASAEAYEVSAYIQGVPLDKSGIIRQNDAVTPCFSRSVAKDIDVRGLLVFFRTPAGEAAGRKTRYAIRETAPDPRKQEAGADAADTDAGPTEPLGEAPAAPPSEPEPETAEAAEAEPASKPDPAEAAGDRLILVDGLDTLCPPFSVGDDLAVGSYILVFQVLGAEETLRQTERPVFFVGDAE